MQRLAAICCAGICRRRARDVQFSIFTHLRKLGFAYFERHPVGETLSFLNTEVTALQQMYRIHFPLLLNGVLFSAIALGMMIMTSPQLALIVVPSFLLYYLFGPRLERLASVTGKAMAAQRVEVNRKVYESMSALTELRVFSALRWDLQRYMQRLTAFNAAMVRTYWFAYWRGTNRRITYSLGALAVFIYGYHLLGRDLLTTGEFVAFLLYYFTAMHRLTVVVTHITEQKVLMHQAEKLYDFMQMQPAVSEAEQPAVLKQVQGAMALRAVTFAYDDGPPILRDMTLEVRAGERLAIVGASGEGKSTILKLLGRFYDPQSGVIELDGVPVDRLSFEALRGSLGMVMQETYLFGASVRDNIRFGDPAAEDNEVEAAARAAYAHDFIMALPEGYDTRVGERGVRLSGGQKQRIAIARMMIKQPRIILLDEATSALDNASEAEVQQAFDTLLSGKTVIAVAHRLSTVRNFDRIALMHDGRIAECGTYEELLAQDGLFRRLVEAGAGSDRTSGQEVRQLD